MDDNVFISPHFKLKELTKSKTAQDHGIDNTPEKYHLINLIWFVWKVLEPVRILVEKPVIVSSGYRSKELNKKIKHSSDSSQHNANDDCAAVDIWVKGMKHEELFNMIKGSLVEYDQLILESGCVHISGKTNNKKPRRRALIREIVSGKPVYKPVV